MAIQLKNLNQKQLNDLIQRAEERKQQIDSERLAKARTKVVALAKSEGFTIEELFGGRGRKKTRRKAAAKYRNPSNRAETWSGRGKRPRWFNAALAAGKKEKDLRV